MSIFELEDYLILDKGSEALKKQFENYCNWCWGYGFGHCDTCRRRFNKYYIPIRKKELIDRMNERRKGNEIN